MNILLTLTLPIPLRFKGVLVNIPFYSYFILYIFFIHLLIFLLLIFY